MPQDRTQVRPRRRRDAAATRKAIIEAATHRFATHGYERAGVREIAVDAGVTAAMVNRYFGSKERLFAEVIERAFDVGHLVRGTQADLADHLARVMVFGRQYATDDVHTPLQLLLHSATNPRAVELFRQNAEHSKIRMLADRIGGEDAEVRAAMVLAQLMGFLIIHDLLRPEPFAHAQSEALVALLSRCLSACMG